MKIVVLAGGISTERDVSLCSGKQVYSALKAKGHSVIMLDVYLGYEFSEKEKGMKLGEIFTEDKDWGEGYGQINTLNPDISSIKALRKDGDKNFFGPNVIALCQEADVVFMALHGENGENGKIQATFDLMGIRYTGTDYVSAAMSMNKAIAKDIFQANNIPTPFGKRLYKKDFINGKLPSEVPFPLIVKACSGGSSIGCAIAQNPGEFNKALEEAFRFDDEVVIEQFIKGKELTCAVIDKKAYPIVEIAPKDGFYDYKNKYQAGSTVEICPAPLEDEITKKIQKTAVDAFEALRLKCYARFDFILQEDGSFFCLEANTLPGMTPTSLVPQEAAAVGISFEDLCEMIIRLS